MGSLFAPAGVIPAMILGLFILNLLRKITIFEGKVRYNLFGVAESEDDFTKFSTIYQWFQTLIHPALMQRHLFLLV
ncbi:hypothetical protein RintRC_7541 [Richelia intracellularis]|nr:hypothetical protein RintRC_7541 [Richelia intracellularis]